MVTVSVIMGAYNCADTLREAIDSIVAQTFTDWELIVCDDASRDATYAVAMEYHTRFPEKITVLKNETNKGLNETLNICLAVARGKFIARMDGDDICAPTRFSEQLAAFENEPELSIVSTGMSYFDESGCWGVSRLPTYPQKEDFLRGTPFCHAACMVRREAYDAVGGYSVAKKLLRVEDYHLWYKMYKAGFSGKNIPQVLYSMRDDRNAYRRRKFRFRLNEAYVVWLITRDFKLFPKGLIYACKPIIVGLIPSFLYKRLHKKKLKGLTCDASEGESI